MITLSSASSTTSSGDTNVTTYDELRDMAIWKVGDKDSTVQCYPSISFETVSTTYPNGSIYNEATGDFEAGLDSTVRSVADGVPLKVPGFYFFKGGRFGFWSANGWEESGDDNEGWDITDAGGDITNLCEVLGGGGGGGDATATDSSIVEFPPVESSACADMGTLEAAEEDCRASNNCGERRLAETNLSADCVDKRKEHCGELEDCAACEEEVRASYACMHGAQCGTELGECTQDAGDATATDSSTGDTPADTPVDTSSAAIRGVVAALAIFAGSSTMLA